MIKFDKFSNEATNFTYPLPDTSKEFEYIEDLFVKIEDLGYEVKYKREFFKSADDPLASTGTNRSYGVRIHHRFSGFKNNTEYENYIKFTKSLLDIFSHIERSFIKILRMDIDGNDVSIIFVSNLKLSNEEKLKSFFNGLHHKVRGSDITIVITPKAIYSDEKLLNKTDVENGVDKLLIPNVEVGKKHGIKLHTLKPTNEISELYNTLINNPRLKKLLIANKVKYKEG